MATVKRTVYILVAILLILIGLCGLVLPILNGVFFLILGFILLSFESPYVEFHLQKIVRKNVILEKWYRKLDIFMKKILK